MPEFTQCDLSFLCRQRWDGLEKTDHPATRYCAHCDKEVFAVRTHLQLASASAVGRCVALTDENDIVGWVGERDYDWMAEESDIVAVRPRGRLGRDTLARLRMAFPKVIWPEDAYVSDAWKMIGKFSPQVAADIEADLSLHFPCLEVRERFVQSAGPNSWSEP